MNKIYKFPGLLIIVFTLFFVIACGPEVIPGTYDGPGTTIEGKVFDATTFHPLENVSISALSQRFHSNENGHFLIPPKTPLQITTLQDGEWGSHRTFLVSKTGYTSQLCVCDMRQKNALAIIKLVPKNKESKQELSKSGVHIFCMPHTKSKE